MWSRLRTKLLTKTSAHDVTDCTHLEFDLAGHVDNRKHVTGDVKMALVDKCSCGSPRLTTRSRRGDGMTSLNRKLEPPGPKSTKNEYTKTTTDNRKKMTSSTNAGHARKEEANNARNALHQSHPRHRLPSNGVTSYHSKPQRDSDDDSEVDTTDWKTTNQKWNDDEKRSSSNYTALNYDVNYVRVSPPKMTRRLKPQPETEMKLTREAQLAASRAASSHGDEAGTQPPEVRIDDNIKTPPVKPRTILAQQRDPGGIKYATEQRVRETKALDVSAQPREAGSGQQLKLVSSESDYIALSDLQASLAQSQLTAEPEVDKLPNITEVVSAPKMDDSRKVTAKMFNDGENSFLQFTFTVKLDSNAVQKSGASAVDGNQTEPVLSGTVDIVKSAQPEVETAGRRKDATITVKPVVSLHGGVVVGREKPEARALSAGSKFTNKPVGIAGIQLTHDNNRRRTKAGTGSRPSSAGTQPSKHDQQRASRRADDVAKLETSESYYHSLVRDNDSDDVGRYEGVDQTGRRETTHMSWDEVMREAKSLGIPLRQPGSGRASERRCSISQLTDGEPVDNVTVWSCSHCRRTVVDQHRPLKTPQTAPVLHKTTSPFKDMFRISNFFGKKVKDDSRSKNASKQTLTLPRGHASRPSAVCDVCGQAEVTSSPCSRRHAETANAAGSRVKYKRSASTPRPGGDGRLQLQSASDSAANRPAAHVVTQRSADDATKKLGNELNHSSSVDFIKGLQQLQKCGWYWGPLSFDDAEARLCDLPDGSFLVRDSSDDRYILSLSFRSQSSTHHTRIEHFKGVFSFCSQQPSSYESSNIVDLINEAVRVSHAGFSLFYLRPRSTSQPAVPVKLLHPVTRRPPSLVELSSVAVRRHFRRHNVDRLPVNADTRDFIKQQVFN